MVSELPSITLKAIGVVRSKLKQTARRNCKDVVSEIVVDNSLTEALDNLEEFSHIIVIYWIHRSRRPAPKKVRPMGNPEHALMGVFATRSPDRPNPIGISTVELLGRRENVPVVKNIDVLDGTPLIDIKPYIPEFDAPGNVISRVGWLKDKLI